MFLLAVQMGVFRHGLSLGAFGLLFIHRTQILPATRIGAGCVFCEMQRMVVSFSPRL